MLISLIAPCTACWQDSAPEWGVQGPVSEHLMSFDWGQNLGRCFGGILNVSAQAWRCVFWSMPLTYLLEVTLVTCCELQVEDIAWCHAERGNVQHADMIMFCKWHESSRRDLLVFMYILTVTEERCASWALTHSISPPSLLKKMKVSFYEFCILSKTSFHVWLWESCVCAISSY